MEMQIQTLKEDTIYLLKLPVGLAIEADDCTCLERASKGDWLMIEPGKSLKLTKKDGTFQWVSQEPYKPIKMQVLEGDDVFMLPLPIGVATEDESGTCLERGSKGCDWLVIEPSKGLKVIWKRHMVDFLTGKKAEAA
jgi:hypothetical protein